MAQLSLDWIGGLRFKNSPNSPAIELHSSTPGVTSPTQALGYSVMACMAMDVVHALEKGRHRIDALTVTFDGERAEHPPRRYLSMTLHFQIVGDARGTAVERAIALSRDKYCSVWNTIRPDVALHTTYDIRGAAAGDEKASGS